jgi:hypothetical protein
MTTQELIELSLLDALGLLDDSERESFESAFRAATPVVQAHVRREQTRLARIDLLLPEVSPPAGLRAAVIEAVRRAMLEPEILRSMPGDLAPSRGVSRVWRAAAVGLATAATVLAATTLYLESEYRQLTSSIQGDTILADLSQTFGGRFVNDVLFNRDTRRVVFHSESPGFTGEASFFTNPEWKDKAKFFCKGVSTPPGKAYTLAVIDENGAVVQELAEISSDGKFLPKEVPFRHTDHARFAILAPDGSGTTVVSRGELVPAS